jgi:hypothetical protein
MNVELGRLAKRFLSFPELLAVASAVTQGKAGFHLQVCRLPLSALEKWDASLNKTLLSRAGAAYCASPALLHAAKSAGGFGTFSFLGLATAACGTELLARLNSPGIVGSVARSRMAAAFRVWPDHTEKNVNKAPYTSFSLYAVKLLRRAGYQVSCPQSRDLLRELYSFSAPASAVVPAHLLHHLDASGHLLEADVMRDGAILPWQDLAGKASDPPAWYEGLRKIRPSHTDGAVVRRYCPLLEEEALPLIKDMGPPPPMPAWASDPDTVLCLRTDPLRGNGEGTPWSRPR